MRHTERLARELAAVKSKAVSQSLTDVTTG